MKGSETYLLNNNIHHDWRDTECQHLKVCKCQSCRVLSKYKNWVTKVFLVGVFFPLMWSALTIFSLYGLLYLPHKIEAQEVQEEELPTMFTKEQKKLKSTIAIPFETQQEMKQLTKKGKLDYSTIFTGNSQSEETLAVTETVDNTSSSELQQCRDTFLWDMAELIIEEHDKIRLYYKKWCMYSCLGLLFYTVLVVFIYLMVCRSSF